MKPWRVIVDLGNCFREIVEFEAYSEALAYLRQQDRNAAELVDEEGWVLWPSACYGDQQKAANWEEGEGFLELIDPEGASFWRSVPFIAAP